jgi:hypothetical protein
MTLRNVSSILSAQILFRGRATDALSLSAPRSRPSVTLFYQTPPGVPARPYPLAPRITDDGTFVFAGDPNSALPQPIPGETLDLRMTISALGYQERSFDFSLTEVELTRIEVARDMNGGTVRVHLLPAPLWNQDVALDPIPVHMYGRVMRAADMVAIAGAQVFLIDPEARGPFAADAQGAFAIRDLPIAPRVTVRITSVGFTTLETSVDLDYRQPVNQYQFSLE